MYKIKILNAISAAGLSQFPKEQYQVGAEVANPDAILVRSTSLHDTPIPPTLQVVGRAGTGVNNIPVAAFSQLGIPVLSTPGANANAVRELVIAGMLIASRHICFAWNYVTQLTANDEIEKRIEQDKKKFVGFELAGKKLGIIGLGNIGVKVANAAIGLGMHVIGYDPTISINRAWELSSSVQQAATLDELLHQSDFVSLHVPLTNDTKSMINAEQIRVMKSGVILLNFSRGDVVNQQDLLNALNEKKIAVYVNDFPSALLSNHPSVISLPHLGASTKEAEENCAVMIVKQMRNFFENGNITHSVNFPTIEMPRHAGATRIAIVNENIPNMVAQISSKLAADNLNIISLSNGSCGNIAYTLLDVDGATSADLLKNITSIPGVIRARILS